ncbi:hypothetical protein E4T56_gene16634 [Termitomyces sp. T112]|nr:hypothetical protein E4T56_gene16634 [Termitomyces sp. T112]
MNGPKASNAVEINDKLFGPYARKLESDNFEIYDTFSGRLAKWLADERAYYPAARPQILRLLKIAQLTLRRNANANADLKSPFNISSCVEHPMVGPYSKLLKAVYPHKDLFVEPDLHAEIKALLKTITAPVSAVHIDLTSEPSSPIEPSPVRADNSTTQPSSSSLAAALQSSSLPPVHSPSAASVSHHLPSNKTDTNPPSVFEVSRTSRGTSDSTVPDTHPGNSVNGDLSTSLIHSGTTHFAGRTKVSSAPNVTPLATSSHAPSVSSPQLSSTTSETSTIPKVKKKKKKKKSGFELEFLIQTDIQDLQKRGVAGVNIKMEPTNVTISNLFDNPVSHSDPSHREVIVLDDAEPVGLLRRITPLPSSSSTAHSLQTEQIGVLEPTNSDADMVVDRLSPHLSERSTSRMDDGNSADMAIDQIPPQLSERRTDNIDVDMSDGTSRTPLVMKSTSPPSHGTFPLIHGCVSPQGSHETEVSTNVTASDPGLKAAAIPKKESEPTKGGNSTVPNAGEAKDYRSSENNIVPRNATSNTSLENNEPQSVTSDAGHIPLMTPSMIDDLHPVNESAFLPPEIGIVQSLQNTLTTVPSVVNGTPQTSTSPSPIVPTPVGSNDPRLVSTGGETILADVTTTTNGIISAHLSSQHSPSIVTPPGITKGSELDVDPVPPPTQEQLRALHAFGPDTKTLLVYKGVDQRRFRFKVRFSIFEEQYDAIARWKNGKNTLEDLSMCTCASLACYSRASARSEQKSIDEISDLPVVWPTGSSLSMNVKYKGQLTVFPLSPPFQVGPNGIVDVSEYMCLGENVIEFDQFDDMSPHIFVLRLHRPTGAQLEQVAERRQKNKAWDDWLLKMAEPMVVRFPPS